MLLKLSSRTNQYLIGVFFGIIIGGFSFFRGSESFGLILALITFVILILSCHLFVEDYALRNILIISFMLKMSLALVNTYIFPLPDNGGDSLTFEKVGWEYARKWLGDSVELSGVSNAYYYSAWIGLIYFFFDRVPFLPVMANVVMGTLVVLIIHKIVFMITGNSKAARTSAIIAMLFPTLNLYSALMLRETVIVFFFSLSFYFFVKWFYQYKFYFVIPSFIFLICSAILHGGLILVLGVYSFFLIFYNPREKRWNRFPVFKIVVVGFILLLLFLISGKILLNYFGGNFASVFSVNFFAGRVTGAVLSDSSYLNDFPPTSILDVVIQTPIRIMYFLFTPFPWMIKGAGHIVGLVDAVSYLMMFVYSIKSIKYVWKENKFLGLLFLMTFLVLIFPFAWGTHSFGTAIRHRQKMVWLIITFVFIGEHFKKLKGNHL